MKPKKSSELYIVSDNEPQDVCSETFVEEFRNLIVEYLSRNVPVVYVIGAPKKGEGVVSITQRHTNRNEMRLVLQKLITGANVAKALTDEQAAKMLEILNT